MKLVLNNIMFNNPLINKNINHEKNSTINNSELIFKHNINGANLTEFWY